MPFVVDAFPGRTFNSLKEYNEALNQRVRIEAAILAKERDIKAAIEVRPSIVAEIKPADAQSLSSRIAVLEAEVQSLRQAVFGKKREVPVGLTLYGESKGRSFTLKVLESGFFCPENKVKYPSLSAAAQGVSGNRRSGWKYWKTSSGRAIGEAVKDKSKK